MCAARWNPPNGRQRKTRKESANSTKKSNSRSVRLVPQSVETTHGTLVIRLPLRLVNALNAREHWAVRRKRTAEQRSVARWMVETAMKRTTSRSFEVTLIRLGGRKMDSDGCVGSFKAIRDGIADALGIDDGSERIRWNYEQCQGGEVGVEIRIKPC